MASIVSTTSGGDSGRWAGTWYQGVKLSLFDISDPNSPAEVDNLILGKRGTQSDAMIIMLLG